MAVKVLRRVDERWLVIWQSPLLKVPQSGLQRVSLPVGVGVEAGDIVAYYFPESLPVSFDEGAGDTRYLPEDLTLGESINASSLSGARQRRAYSLGVYGLLN